ncbi:MAG: hypothetical protein HGA31_02450 [Candidatus Moranbacteria bacterium]|nr:hypothetical protein [Candidatus Moranbacteria bacterium]
MRTLDTVEKTIFAGVIVAIFGNLFLGVELMALPLVRYGLPFVVSALWGVILWLLIRRKPSQPWGVLVGMYFGAISFIAFPMFWMVFHPWLSLQPSASGIPDLIGVLFGRAGLIEWTAYTVTCGGLGFLMSITYMFLDVKERAES